MPAPPPYTDEHLEALERWAGRQIADRLKPKDRLATLQLFLMLSRDDDWQGRDEVAKALDIKAGRYDDADFWKGLVKVDQKQLEAGLFECVRESYRKGVRFENGGVALNIAQALGADLEAEWQPTAEDLQSTYSLDRLRQVAAEHGYDVPPKAKDLKSVATAIAKVWRAGDLPKEFRAAAEVADR